MKAITVLLLALFCVATCLAVNNQVHLALTGKATEMAVSWFSTVPLDAALVSYFSNMSDHHSVTGFSATFNKPSGYAHHAVLTNLKPSTKYHYRVRAEHNTWTDTYTFWTANETWTGPWMVPVYGDMGVNSSQNTIMQLNKLVKASQDRKLAEGMPFILHVGDISYANDRPSHEYEYIWNLWFQLMSNTLNYMPYMVMPGNHEKESGKPFLHYSQYFVDYNYRFKMPLATPLPQERTEHNYYGTPRNMYWSFDYQNVHFVAISTETGYKHSPDEHVDFANQMAWLEKDLEAASRNRHRVPWVIVMGHRPLYSTSDSKYILDQTPILQAAIEDLLHKNEVDLFLCGHVHAYERTYPVYKNKTVQESYHSYNKKGIVVITAGAAGDIEGLSHGWVKAEWSAVRYGKRETYGLLHVLSDSRLQWDLYESTTNKLFDTITITK
eukprot:TRINITY_DN15659_c0_g1_i1.p1 TRINITY_DN15659_c0_g1~~TRINITY_DN15659_c0_g1_i1.p1  ORF type:complete len:439 (+),score=58.89 TRINITY_DN15659_c0_g1_i1:2-1318(+)